MLHYYERPFTDEERAKLAAPFERRAPTRREMLWSLAFWVGLFIFGVVLLQLKITLVEGRTGSVATFGALLTIPGVLACLIEARKAYLAVVGYYRDRREQERFEREEAPALRAAVDHGLASVCRVTAGGVALIFEQNDVFVLFDLGDGTTFTMHDTVCFGEESEVVEPWPAAEFELVRAAKDDRWLGAFNFKQQLEPELTVQADEIEDYYKRAPHYIYWTDSPFSASVMQGTPREIINDLGYKPKSDA